MPFARVNGTMLYYREAGEGELAVFIHGFPFDHSMWLDQLTGLAHVRRCVALDLRGFGRSDPTLEPALSMEVLADDIAALIAALGAQQADIVGLSMGGYVALALYELRPELVRSISLLDTRAEADSTDSRRNREQLVSRLLDRGRTDFASSLVSALLAPDPPALIQARVRSMVESTRYETMVSALEGMKVRADRTGTLRTITVPSLVMGGDLDTLTPPAVLRDLAEAIPGARFVTVTGAGHVPPIERPNAVNSALIELFEGRKVVWWRE